MADSTRQSAVSNKISFDEFVMRADQKIEQYEKEIVASQGADVFKYFLLMNAYLLEKYVYQSRIQSAHTFTLSVVASIVGFVIIAVAIVLGIIQTGKDLPKMEVAYLTASAGAITQFIAGVFLALHNKTMDQINNLQNKLTELQKEALQRYSDNVKPKPRDTTQTPGDGGPDV